MEQSIFLYMQKKKINKITLKCQKFSEVDPVLRLLFWKGQGQHKVNNQLASFLQGQKSWKVSPATSRCVCMCVSPANRYPLLTNPGLVC